MSKILPEILEVLSELEFPEPRHARLPARLGRLDRGLYVKLDKVLRALGGSWVSGIGVHVFDGPEDASTRVERALTSGEVTTDCDLGNFLTPARLAVELVALADVRVGHRALEPSAGTGRLIDALLAVGAVVTAVERHSARREALAQRIPAERRRGRDLSVSNSEDFLCFGGIPAYDRVIMNPPFCRSGAGDHLDHVRRAHDLLLPGGILVSVLPSSLTFRRDRRYAEFRSWMADAGPGSVLRELPAGTFRESGTDVRTVVISTRKAS